MASVVVSPSRSSSAPSVGHVMLILTGALLVVSATLKFAGVRGVINEMARSGFADGKLMFIATLEAFAAALFLWPRTRSIGLLLVSSYLGGAICTHVQMGEYVKCVPPSVILSVAWFGTLLKHPQVLWSFAVDSSKSVAYRAESGGGLPASQPL